MKIVEPIRLQGEEKNENPRKLQKRSAVFRCVVRIHFSGEDVPVFGGNIST
jgi:hypothetical protein